MGRLGSLLAAAGALLVGLLLLAKPSLTAAQDNAYQVECARGGRGGGAREVGWAPSPSLVRRQLALRHLPLSLPFPHRRSKQRFDNLPLAQFDRNLFITTTANYFQIDPALVVIVNVYAVDNSVEVQARPRRGAGAGMRQRWERDLPAALTSLPAAAPPPRCIGAQFYILAPTSDYANYIYGVRRENEARGHRRERRHPDPPSHSSPSLTFLLPARS